MKMKNEVRRAHTAAPSVDDIFFWLQNDNMTLIYELWQRSLMREMTFGNRVSLWIVLIQSYYFTSTVDYIQEIVRLNICIFEATKPIEV